VIESATVLFALGGKMSDTKLNLMDLDHEGLNNFMLSLDEKKFRADQLMKWIYQFGVTDFSRMTNINKPLRERLASLCEIRAPEVKAEARSSDGTIKWALDAGDGQLVETVYIPEDDRATLCVSTQVGCSVGCPFCSTGHQGFNRNLTTAEIIGQVWRATESLGFTPDAKYRAIDNVVLMGMGEPLNNLENVHRVCCTLHNQSLFNMGSKRMTVSTSGVVPKIKELVDRNTPCCLAVSLNSTNNEYRSSVMPVNKTWPIEKLLEAVDEYIRRTDNYVTFEFVLIQDITCTPKAAKELIRICAPRRVKVNAIVLNDGDDPTLHAPTPEQVEDFLAMVRAAEIQITIRNPRGRDILAACGQLAYKKEGKVC
jgi:23S rRNA (adenine2503-C2)-methyltransferase